MMNLPVFLLTCYHCQGHVPAEHLVANSNSAAIPPCINRPHHGEMKGEDSVALVLQDAPVLQVSSCKVAPMGFHHMDPKGTGQVVQGAWQVSCRASCGIDHRVGWAIET